MTTTTKKKPTALIGFIQHETLKFCLIKYLIVISSFSDENIKENLKKYVIASNSGECSRTDTDSRK